MDQAQSAYAAAQGQFPSVLGNLAAADPGSQSRREGHLLPRPGWPLGDARGGDRRLRVAEGGRRQLLRHAVIRSGSRKRSVASRAFICGLAGTELSTEEGAFLRDARPWGVILFKRNADNPEQVKRLCRDVREALEREDAPILIDQEGGRVQRIGPPHFRAYPAGRVYGQIYEKNPLAGVEAAFLGAKLIALDLHALGISVNCLPVLDMAVEGGHHGDRRPCVRKFRRCGGDAWRRSARRHSRRRTAAGHQAHARTRASDGRQPHRNAAGRRHDGGAGGAGFHAVPAPGEACAARNDRARRFFWTSTIARRPRFPAR